jgi:hypothetical protein
MSAAFVLSGGVLLEAMMERMGGAEWIYRVAHELILGERNEKSHCDKVVLNTLVVWPGEERCH